MNHCHNMCSYNFAPYEVEFSDCGQIRKFTFYFLPLKSVKSGHLTVGHEGSTGCFARKLVNLFFFSFL